MPLFLVVLMVLIRRPQVLRMKNSIHKGKIHCPFPEPSGLCRVVPFLRRKGGSHVGGVGAVFYIEGAPRVLGVWGQVNTLSNDKHS